MEAWSHSRNASMGKKTLSLELLNRGIPSMLNCKVNVVTVADKHKHADFESTPYVKWNGVIITNLNYPSRMFWDAQSITCFIQVAKSIIVQ